MCSQRSQEVSAVYAFWIVFSTLNVVFTGVFLRAQFSLTNRCPVEFGELRDENNINEWDAVVLPSLSLLNKVIRTISPWSLIHAGSLMVSFGSPLSDFAASEDTPHYRVLQSGFQLVGSYLAYTGVMQMSDEETLKNETYKSIEKIFSNGEGTVNATIELQETFSCCGVKNYEDWRHPSLIDYFPANCCVHEYRESCFNPFKNGSEIQADESLKYRSGCAEVVEKGVQGPVECDTMFPQGIGGYPGNSFRVVYRR